MWQRLKALTITKKALLVGAGAVVALGVAGAANPQTKTLDTSATHSTTLEATVTPAKPVLTTKTVTETQGIPFTSSTVDDPTLAQGTTKVTTAGVNGTRTITYTVSYKDGTETGRVQTSDVVTTPPVNEVVAHGTMQPQPSCPNGTYVNTYGNTVCSPYDSPTAPAGATAQCVDGTYSFSQSRSGTCSHHGGVASWL